MGWVIAVTCAFLARAIWVRRLTLVTHTDQAKIAERTMTTYLICVAVGIALMCPWASETIGYALHAATGQWNLEDWMGHCLLIGGAGNLGIHVGCRLNVPLETVLASFRRTFSLPFTIVGPVMLFLLVHSPNGDVEQPDMLDAPTDGWLDAYWTVLCGFMIWVLGQTIRGLICLRADPRHRRNATFYMVSCRAGIGVCALRIAMAWLDINCAPLLWIGVCGAAVAIGYTAADSWRNKVRWLAGHDERTGELL